MPKASAAAIPPIIGAIRFITLAPVPWPQRIGSRHRRRNALHTTAAARAITGRSARRNRPTEVLAEDAVGQRPCGALRNLRALSRPDWLKTADRVTGPRVRISPTPLSSRPLPGDGMQPTALVPVMAATIYSGRTSGVGKKTADAIAKAQSEATGEAWQLWHPHKRAVDRLRRAPVPRPQHPSVTPQS